MSRIIPWTLLAGAAFFIVGCAERPAVKEEGGASAAPANEALPPAPVTASQPPEGGNGPRPDEQVAQNDRGAESNAAPRPSNGAQRPRNDAPREKGAFPEPPAEARVALAGRWVLMVSEQITNYPLALLEMTEVDGTYAAEVLDVPERVQSATVASLEAAPADENGDAVDVRLILQLEEGAQVDFEGRLDDGAILGNISLGGQILAARLVPTDAESADDLEEGRSPQAEPFLEALQARDVDALREFIDEHPRDPLALLAQERLAFFARDRGWDAERIREEAERTERMARQWGLRKARLSLVNFAAALARQQYLPDVALELLDAAEEGLGPDPAPELAALIRAGRMSAYLGSDDPALRERGMAMARESHEEVVHAFAAERIPAEELDAGNRVVTCELFTGAHCGPCVAADLATSGIEVTYPQSHVIVLRYHQHVPGPDPLANADSEARFGYYEGEGTPTVVVNGRATEPLGGFLPHGAQRYETLRRQVAALLPEETELRISLEAQASDGQLALSATVTGTPEDAGDLRLRFVLAEDAVVYQAPNGILFHEMLVRSMPGGPEGTAAADGVLSHSETIDLAELRDGLRAYLAEVEADWQIEFPERPLDLEKLHVVALVQDDETKEVLQAASVAVNAAP